MNEVEQFYRDSLREKSRQPFHNFQPEHYESMFSAFNHYCGDELDIFLCFSEGKLSGYFQGDACAICNVSTSVMMQLIEHKPVAEVVEISEQVLNFLGSDRPPNKLTHGDGDYSNESLSNESLPASISAVEFLSPVKKFPIRLKCASLSWRGLKTHLKEYSAR